MWMYEENYEDRVYFSGHSSVLSQTNLCVTIIKQWVGVKISITISFYNLTGETKTMYSYSYVVQCISLFFYFFFFFSLFKFLFCFWLYFSLSFILFLLLIKHPWQKLPTVLWRDRQAWYDDEEWMQLLLQFFAFFVFLTALQCIGS